MHRTRSYPSSYHLTRDPYASKPYLVVTVLKALCHSKVPEALPAEAAHGRWVEQRQRPCVQQAEYQPDIGEELGRRGLGVVVLRIEPVHLAPSTARKYAAIYDARSDPRAPRRSAKRSTPAESSSHAHQRARMWRGTISSNDKAARRRRAHYWCGCSSCSRRPPERCVGARAWTLVYTRLSFSCVPRLRWNHPRARAT